MDQEKVKRQVTHKNHYVPQFYLKNWSNNGNTIFTYETIVPNKNKKLWRSGSIKTSSCWSDFYTLHIDGLDDDSFEKELDRKYENPAKPVFDKVRLDISLTTEEQAILVEFIIIQMVRTPQWFLKSSKILRDSFESIVQNSVNKTISDFESGKLSATKKEELKKYRPETKFVQPIKITIDKENSQLVATTYTGRVSFLSTIKQVVNGFVGRMLRSYDWVILKAPEGLSFPTSDNPVVIAGYRSDKELSFDCGIGVNNVDIFLPLDPSHILFTEIGKSKAWLKRLELNDELMRRLQEGILQNPAQYIYSNNPIQNIEQIRPRIIDKDLFQTIKFERVNWHTTQSELEKEYGLI
ncbi:MAG: DUF4238 domain-containing protein [Eggerthellaceae bacterium]|nr:DUF4238 domain-containing protein [Eggerthellaceae bacterium]